LQKPSRVDGKKKAPYYYEALIKDRQRPACLPARQLTAGPAGRQAYSPRCYPGSIAHNKKTLPVLQKGFENKR